MNWEMNSVLNSVKFHSLEKWKYEEVKHLCKELNLYELRPVEALHGIPAKSVSLRHSSGVHLVYSGDTMPNEQLIKRGFDCDILIHEATFQQKDIAQKSYHSTVEDAIDVSERMKAKHTILTNFVNEDLSQQTRELLLSKSNVTVAVDFMRVRMSDLPYTPLLNPFLIHR
ncbi:zinc phosphodiesterase ELAC protein 2 homolog [Ylistrum balloti]|uniref:zinc phosphodiesterase ELAC protein 2 homolog n=1 Tax=Ylistrum balloti TaxID=509963 RepID=UPI0029058C1D|nr:zinc phosphodiesterase ELAC protein 2 homolog [Ylistrum balloti]